MLPSDSSHPAIAELWQRVASERQRAARAAAIAARYEADEARDPQAPESVRLLRARLAELHRQIESRHRASAALQELHAARMDAWLSRPDGDAFRPAFMAAVAATLGIRGAVATLGGPRRGAVLTAASDVTAREAHNLEIVLGEGPAAEAVTERGCNRVAGTALRDRWPLYGPAVAELGVQAVIAVPLQVSTACIGALCAYDGHPVIREGVAAAARQLAGALTDTMLNTAELPEAAGGLPAMPLFEEADYQAVVHQAAGMVSVMCECGVDDAEDLLRARAFAEGQPVEQIATRVVRGETRLC